MACRSRILFLLLPLLATAAHAVEFSGLIRSATGSLPAALMVEADQLGDKPVITGSVDKGRYRVELPSPGTYRLRLQAPGWEAEPKIVFDPATTGARDFLIYPATLPEPELAAELIRLGEQDQELRMNWPEKPDAAFWKRMEEEDRARSTAGADHCRERLAAHLAGRPPGREQRLADCPARHGSIPEALPGDDESSGGGQ